MVMHVRLLSCLVLFHLTLCEVKPEDTTSNASSQLAVSLWKVYSDTAVFDWYITMEKKERMERCDLTYGEEGRSNSTKVMENFLPIHRSFNLHPLRQNTTYWVTMVCTDNQAALHSSPTLTFTTDISSSDKPVLGAKFSHMVQVEDNPTPLYSPSEAASTDFRSKVILSIKPRDRVSPHTVLGAGCGLVGLIIMMITSGLVLSKYSKFRAENEKVWEERNEISECSTVELDTISLYCDQKQMNDELEGLTDLPVEDTEPIVTKIELENHGIIVNT